MATGVRPRYSLLPLLVQTGRVDAYRPHCDQMWTRFREAGALEIWERAAKGSLLPPKSGFDIQQSVLAINDDGSARIGATRYKVIQLAAEHFHHGWTAEELMRQHPDLRPEEVYAALMYFYDPFFR